MEKRLEQIIERWFISEPALFAIACTHPLQENTQMKCPLRCGKRVMQYNPLYIQEMSDPALEQAMRCEAVRLLLKHPYERRPDQCCDQAIAMGSTLTIADNYVNQNLNIEHPSDFSLEGGREYEWYSRRIQEMLPPSQEGEGGAQNEKEGQSDSARRLQQNAQRDRDLSALWEEDDMTLQMINGVIESCKDWGSLGGAFAEKVKASTRSSINWKNVLNGFRSSVLSSASRLTRMKPNRRTGYLNMGTQRKFTTRILVAVDVSGSISSECLQYFYGVINSAFKYGVSELDTIEFDAGITKVQSLRSKMKSTLAVGRGGTSFQEPIDYAIDNRYDGLVILTDGYAPEPTVRKSHTKILWVCSTKQEYEAHKEWMKKSGRVCPMNIR